MKMKREEERRGKEKEKEKEKEKGKGRWERGGRLAVMLFLEYFIWGCWLVTFSAYWFQNKGWDGRWFGATFSTMAISSLIMPALMGVAADKYFNSEKILSALHAGGALFLFLLPFSPSPFCMFILMLIYMLFYKPTLSITTSISYAIIERESGKEEIKEEYPMIRVWATVGFIAALWAVSLAGWESSPYQFYLSSCASFVLSFYSLSLPPCPPISFVNQITDQNGDQMSVWKEVKDKVKEEMEGIKGVMKGGRLSLFFLFVTLLGAALQLTNAYGDTFFHDFAKSKEYQNSLLVKYPAIFMSISQISEIVFILTIPFFIRQFGIKYTIAMSMAGWVIRFGCFAYGNPTDKLWLIIVSCIAYGPAFDFFLVAGSMFVDGEVEVEKRAAGQGLFMCFVGGIGPLLGNFFASFLIHYYFTNDDGSFDWQSIWLSFAAYSLLLLISFLLFFHHKERLHFQYQIIP